MVRTIGVGSSACVMSLVLGAAAIAELPRESRDLASHVIAGKVVKVFHRDGGVNNEYLVQVRIDSVFKGENYAKGDTVHVYVFQRKPGQRVEPAASGHDAVPREGQHIKAWGRARRGQVKGLYPAWFETLPAPEAAPTTKAATTTKAAATR